VFFRHRVKETAFVYRVAGDMIKIWRLLFMFGENFGEKFGENLGHAEDFHKVGNGGGVLWLRGRLVFLFAFVNGQVPCLIEHLAEAAR
jgi:hypothetical protein